MMNQSIIIQSVYYDGELAEVLFKPDNDDVVLNFGEVTLPFLFEPYLLLPPREVYGMYTIKPIEADCPYFLNVPRPTPTPTPTVTPTKTPTPTPTPTNTPGLPSSYCLWYELELISGIQYALTWTLKDNFGNPVLSPSILPITFYRVNSGGVVNAMFTAPTWKINAGQSTTSSNININFGAGEYLVAASGQTGTISDPQYCGIAYLDCGITANQIYCN